jgi:hypothetical protein
MPGWIAGPDVEPVTGGSLRQPQSSRRSPIEREVAVSRALRTPRAAGIAGIASVLVLAISERNKILVSTRITGEPEA